MTESLLPQGAIGSFESALICKEEVDLITMKAQQEAGQMH